MSQGYIYLCGTPELECVGGKITRVCNSYRGSKKGHASRDEAFKCYSKYLIRNGWTRIGSREFAGPNGGPVRVLTKKTRFGGRLRQGKENTRWMYERASGIVY